MLPSYSTTSTKKELPVLEYIDKGYIATCAPNTHNLQMRQLPYQYAYRINPITTILLRLQPKQPIVLICIQSINQPIVPMCLRSTDQPIDELYIQPLSPPDARTVLLPESDNCHAYTPAIYRPNDRANTPAIPIIVMPIRLQPKHD